MKIKALREYSLWLMPKDKKAEIFNKLLVDAARQAKTGIFEPHITLLGGIRLKQRHIIKNMEKLVSKLTPFKISFIKSGSTEEFYKSVFLECKKTKKLMQANKLAQRIFSKDYRYIPHMSIVYGNVSSSTKDKIVNSVSTKLLKSMPFIAESIVLCRAFGKFDEWKLIHESKFKSV